jgi:hypothetical protein
MTSPKKRAHLKTPTNSHIDVLRAARTREAGGNWAIKRSDGLDCIEHGWLTEDYYLTDLGKKILNTLIRVKIA